MDANSVAIMITIVVSVLGSSLTTIRLLLRQMNHLEVKLTAQSKDADEKFTTRIDRLDEKFTTRIDRLDEKFTGRLDRLDDKVTDIRERLARVEGHLMAPEGFTLRRHPSQASEKQIPDDPPTDHREAG